MNKKSIGIIIIVIAIACCIGGFMLLRNNRTEKENNTNSSVTTNDGTQDKSDNNINNTGKVLVVYFSATNNTKIVAEKIAKNLNGDLFEIVPEDEYTSDDLNYSNSNSRVSKEHNDETLRNVKLKTTTVDNWDSYDTVLIGYPIWWQVAAWPVNTFVEANNFNGKTVIPFCTSVSSGLGQSGKLLENVANGGNWLEGHRFSSRPSDSDIKEFNDGIK